MELSYSNYENAAVYVALASVLINDDADECPQHPPSINPVFASKDSSVGTLAQKLSTGLRCKYPAYVLALLYLRRLRGLPRRLVTISPTTLARLAAVAAIVATKFFDDIYFSNEYYAHELEIDLTALNEMEVVFITLMDFKLLVSATQFASAMFNFAQSRLPYCRDRPVRGFVDVPPVDSELLLALHFHCCCQFEDVEDSAPPRESCPRLSLQDKNSALRLARFSRSRASSTQSSCSTVDTFTTSCRSNNCLCVKKLTPQCQEIVHDFLARRTQHNCRLKSEHEHLCDSRLHMKAKSLSRLLSQAATAGCELPMF